MTIIHDLSALRTEAIKFFRDASGLVIEVSSQWKSQGQNKPSYPFLAASTTKFSNSEGLADYSDKFTTSPDLLTRSSCSLRRMVIEVDVYSKPFDGAVKDAIIILDDLITTLKTINSTDLLFSKGLTLRDVREPVSFEDFVENEWIWRANTEFTFSFLSNIEENMDFFNQVGATTGTFIES